MSVFKTILFLIIFAYSSLIYSGTAHYANGFLDISCSTIPKPGLYYALYYSYYASDNYKDQNGDDSLLVRDVVSKAISGRLVWVTDYKILGADYGVQFSFSADKQVTLEIDSLGLKIDDAGFSDPQLTPLVLSWYNDMSEITLTYGVYLPWGNYDKDELVNAGKNHFTHTFALGGTFYFDEDKSYFFSILPRYQIAQEEKYSNITEGDVFSFEWGAGKKFLQGIVTVGITGYSHWQVSADNGASNNFKDQVHGIGPAITVLDYKNLYKAGIRYYKEFDTEDRYEGDFFVFSFFKKI